MCIVFLSSLSLRFLFLSLILPPSLPPSLWCLPSTHLSWTLTFPLSQTQVLFSPHMAFPFPLHWTCIWHGSDNFFLSMKKKMNVIKGMFNYKLSNSDVCKTNLLKYCRYRLHCISNYIAGVFVLKKSLSTFLIVFSLTCGGFDCCVHMCWGQA